MWFANFRKILTEEKILYNNMRINFEFKSEIAIRDGATYEQYWIPTNGLVSNHHFTTARN